MLGLRTAAQTFHLQAHMLVSAHRCAGHVGPAHIFTIQMKTPKQTKCTCWCLRTGAQAMLGLRTALQSKQKHPSKQSAHVGVCAQVHRPCWACAQLHNPSENAPANKAQHTLAGAQLHMPCWPCAQLQNINGTPPSKQNAGISRVADTSCCFGKTSACICC